MKKIKMADRKRILEVLEMIIADSENDASRFEGKPFNGKTVAEYLGCQAAAIQALAKIVHNDIDESRPTKHTADSSWVCEHGRYKMSCRECHPERTQGSIK